jgi:hypothetical protein
MILDGISVKELIMFAFFAGAFVLETRGLKKEIINLNEKLFEMKKDLKEDIARLEIKQDKYNNLQERTALIEASTKSAHHRINEFKKGN